MQTTHALIAANWKMNKTIAESVAYIHELLRLDPELDGIEAVIFPSFISMKFVSDALDGKQNRRRRSSDVGRRLRFVHGRDQRVAIARCRRNVGTARAFRAARRRRRNRRIDQPESACRALRFGIHPIVCVGESEADHHAGNTHAHVVAQARAAFADVDPAGVSQCRVAYEPIWAIGSGSSDTPESANAVLRAIREAVPGLERAQLLYGGSVKAGQHRLVPRSAAHRRRTRRQREPRAALVHGRAQRCVERPHFMSKRKPLVLAILDGWGVRTLNKTAMPSAAAKLPNWTRMHRRCIPMRISRRAAKPWDCPRA